MSTIARLFAGLAALLLLALVMAYLAGFFNPTITPGTTPRAQLAEIPVTEVQLLAQPRVEQATGTVSARNEVLVAARITATVESVAVDAGDSVTNDELLLTLDDRDLAARVAQQAQMVESARARVSEARPAAERIRDLARRGVASQAELEQAEATLRAAEAELARAEQALTEARTALSYTEIRSPFAGRVSERRVDPGDTATPGESLLRIYDPEALRLTATVRESLASRLQAGQTLPVRIDALDLEVDGEISEIVPAADPGSRSFEVRVALPARENLYPGMFGRLGIPLGTEARLAIPREAVAHYGQLEFVEVLGEEGVLRRYIRTGRELSGGRVEVLSGLQVGERVVMPAGG